MEILNMKNPYLNGFENEDDELAVLYLNQLTKAYNALHNGTLYARFIDGDRKGSVAKLTPNTNYVQGAEPTIKHWRPRFNSKINFRFENEYLYTVCNWKGRRNKVQLQVPHRDVELIVAEQLDTVWELFDVKAAKAEVLSNPNQTDIDGNVLEIGDEVMFINISYGSRMYLQRGTVKEFKASVNSSSTKISTVIENEAGVKCELNFPSDMVWKRS